MIRKLLFALLLLLSAGCRKETIECPDGSRSNPDGSIAFSLETDDARTKGTPRNSLEKYETVCVNVFSHTSDYEAADGNDVAFVREIKLKQEAPNWKYTPPMYWPAGQKLSFFAYASDIPFADAGVTFSPATGTPDSIIYKVPADATKQPDLLLAAKYNHPQAGNVSLTMKHALACVSFCGLAPQKGTYVKSITLRNVCGEGALALNDSAIIWNVNGNSKGVTVFEPGIKEDKELGKAPLPDNNYLMTADGYLMMIPQTLADAAIDVLYWNGKDDSENKAATYILPVDNESYAAWKPGRKYIYKFGSQSEEDITVVYYEKYADNTYGICQHDNETLNDTKEIVEAGYGVIAQKYAGTVARIRLASQSSTPVTTGRVVELMETGPFLYPVSQSGDATFALPESAIPTDVYFNNSNQPCGMIVPHFAKGVYNVKTPVTTHAIRTPQQMRNITSLSVPSVRRAHTYTQELNLDFSKTSIGGDPLTAPVVNREFNGLFEGRNMKIENVKINALVVNGGLFLSNYGEIKEVVLANSSITSSGNAGGIAAINESDGVITNPRIIGENDADKKIIIEGSLYVGAIAGLNYGEITGNTSIEPLTELPVAEVSGWVSIKGVNQPVGGITGENRGTITTCLINSVYVTNTVNRSKITIKGGDYVGGLVGVNRATVVGNRSGAGPAFKAEPDVAGFVAISGNNFVGGIAGQNSGAGILNQVNVRLGRGDATDALTITGAVSVGGIVGFNTEGGTLQTESNSFISVRGNIVIHGTQNVGGIVGNNQSGNISNCFVYNFYSQSAPLVHHAPRITGAVNVGGIVGYAGVGAINNCAVFSTVSDANAAGENATNAAVDIKATKTSAGGIAGHSFNGLTIAASSVLGNVKINGTGNSGGIVGENNAEISFASVHIGNSGAQVADIYKNLFDAVRLPVRESQMHTASGMTSASGTPAITGGGYIGGICGVNWAGIEAATINDNVKIGTPASSYVGGIAGGNGEDATIKNCKTHNPPAGTATVEIEGLNQIGGIVGLNNGIVNQCRLGEPGAGSSRAITIKGAELVGGIAGTSDGHKNYMSGGHLGSGNDNTRITDCNVYGKVRIEAKGTRAGGIIGQNGPTNRITGCNVIGYTSSYTNSTNFNYDITLSGTRSIGGIAGVNYGIIHGTADSYTKVTHTAVIASEKYAGGLVGEMKARKNGDAANTPFQSMLYHCDVSHGILIHKPVGGSGAFAGLIDGEGATNINPTLYGTAPSGPTNKIYIGTTDPVRISVNNDKVIFPPPINSLPLPPDPPDPAKTGNLWADYLFYNYLYYTKYE